MPTAYSDTITSDPTTLPVSLADALRALDLDDSNRNVDIERWILEGAAKLRHDARVALITETRRRKLHAFPAGGLIVLDSVAPLASVTSIAYLDGAGASQTLATSVYSVDTDRRPGQIWLKYGQSWPATRAEPNAVTITYTAGYGAAATAIPGLAQQAILSLVRLRLDHPDDIDTGGVGEAPQGYAAAVEYLSWGGYP